MLKIIKDFENYSISDDGKVYRNKDNLLLKTFSQHKGYECISLSKNGIKKRKMIHRLVAENFLSRESLLQQVNHVDGNKLNNNLSNLEWTTIEENLKHAFANNLINLAKLDKKQVDELFLEIKKFTSAQAIKYSVTEDTIKRVMLTPGYFYRR
jgi:hypothetical protein